MKKVILAVALSTVMASAVADGHAPPFRGAGSFAIPLIIGGVVGYAISQSQNPPQNPPPNAQPPVYPPASELFVQPVPVPPPQPVFADVMEWDAQCRCYWKIRRQVGWK